MPPSTRPKSDNDNNVREYHLKWMAETADFRSRNRVVGVGNVAGASVRAIDALMGHISGFGRRSSCLSNSFVYVVSDEEQRFTKIGYAVSPSRRLAELQTGSPHKLFIYRAFSFLNADVAREVEYNAHIAAEMRHRRMVGEWFECNPVQAHEIVDAAADMAGYAYCVFTPIVDKENTTPRLVA